MKNPIVSIVIPTYNSENILEVALRGIANQKCPKQLYEIIIADNHSTDHTKEIAQKYGARIIEVHGKAPQVCRQRNLGAKAARGDYILILDHDVELSQNLIKNFARLLKTAKTDIDSWYVPYKNVASSKLLTEVRNLEDEFYQDSVVAAARLIKKEFIKRTGVEYDPNLSSGPADWDFNIQLKLAGAKFGYLKDCVYHHEEGLGFWKYTTKKTAYIKGGELYKDKWRKKNYKIYEDVVKRQYHPFHRLFWIFIEKGKWKKLMRKLHIYLLFLFPKIIMSMVYFYHLKTKKYA